MGDYTKKTITITLVMNGFIIEKDKEGEETIEYVAKELEEAVEKVKNLLVE